MSDSTWRVLLTGPLEGRDEWVEAAGRAGWEAVEAPLLERAPVAWSVEGLARPSWIALTSSGALQALADLARTEASWTEVPVAAVGERTAQRARDLGFQVPVVAKDPRAAGLARELAQAAPEHSILWLRGDKGRDLGETLTSQGLSVEERVVYQTRPRKTDALPDADVVFFASPSAVEVWREVAPERVPGALAIGWTTLDALQQHESAFSFALPLITPEPLSLTVALDAISQAP